MHVCTTVATTAPRSTWFSCKSRSRVFPRCFSSFLTLCFFFFQAEDGIRDVAVTGVQTCALPIWLHRHEHLCARQRAHRAGGDLGAERRAHRRFSRRCDHRHAGRGPGAPRRRWLLSDRKSTRLNSSHGYISYAVFCLKKKKQTP